MFRSLFVGTCLLVFHVCGPAFSQVRTVDACEITPAPANCSGLYALEIKQDVPNGAYVHVPDPGCMNDATSDIDKIIQGAVVAGTPSLALFSGSISKVVSGPVGNYLKSTGGDVGKYFSPYAKNGAMCAPVIGVVPKDATIVGYRLARCDSKFGCSGCAAGADCGYSKFQGEPIVQKSSAMQTATTVFMNWSHDLTRQAIVTIFYRSPQKPLVNM